ncbi:glycoside hydrolase [Nocardioides mangrovicus]|uniref:Glycoside hydrolase n=1 Tax=Nocardioides mangrovicus TaxID=2478913 RepID=A0A3L8P008_9ACTN|nr:glycoside hydrolase family 9 protein [Nocardioides mangrovicus]RLV48143.1 glycoside hydrolase [Nocardioides mangrovicus]
MRRILIAALGLALTAPATALSAAASTSSVTGVVRLDQQGYLPGEHKPVVLMTTGPVARTRWVVRDASGHAVLRGRVPARAAGSWSSRFPDVYRFDVARVRTPGRYRLTTSGGVRATSPWFRVASAEDLYGELLDDGVAFDQNQRDGADQVAGPLHRQPSHLNDASATTYAWPRMQAGEDLILDPTLTPTGGPVDVAGGWFDAGDYLKFTHSTAYNDVLLFTSARLLGSKAPAALLAEARYGERWLEKTWDPSTGRLLLQVGIGSGNKQGTFIGDHDGWREPQADDADTATGHQYVSHRPVFVANPDGGLISPNLAGRVSAAFALAAQADAATDASRAAHELSLAESLYAHAATSDVPHPLVTALPHAFYPESTWRDDMALGGAEIALARHALGQDATAALRAAARWTRAYLRHPGTDTLNLYDVGALADSAMGQALRTIGHGHLTLTRRALARDLARQVGTGIDHARTDPFRSAASVDDFDVNSHTYGLVAVVGLYDRLVGTRRFQGWATTWRTWLLGGDPWGVTSMVGVGTRSPRCMQHQIANLATGGALDVGAVVNGPNGKDNFDGGLGGFQDGMVHCTSPGLRRFDGQGSRYVDDVRAWQTDEPALDMTGSAIVAAAAQLAAR